MRQIVVVVVVWARATVGVHLACVLSFKALSFGQARHVCTAVVVICYSLTLLAFYCETAIR